MRRTRRKPACEFCLGIGGGSQHQCPQCGRKLIHSLPTLADITRETEEIRRHWSLGKLRAGEHYHEASVPEIHHVADNGHINWVGFPHSL